CSIVTPGFRRPNAVNVGLSGLDGGSIPDHSEGRGTHTSAPANGNWKSGGRMPTMAYGTPPSVNDLPIALGSLLNLLCQNWALIITTAGAPGLSSCARNPRPCKGLTPSMCRKFPETRAPLRTSGSL